MISRLLRCFSTMVSVPVDTEFLAMIRRLDFSTFRERIEKTMDSKSSPFEPDSTGDDDSNTTLGHTLRVLEENPIVRLCKEKAQAVAAIGLYKSAISYYQEKLDEREACIEGLEETVGSLEETCEMLASQLACGRLPGDIDALGMGTETGAGIEIETETETDSAEEVHHLRVQLDNLHNELEDTNLQNLSLATQLSERMCAYVDMKIDLVGTKNELANMMQSLRTEEASHRASKVQSEEKIAEISRELSKRNLFIAGLVKEKELADVKFVGLEKTIQELSSDLASLMKERRIEAGYKDASGSPGSADAMLPTPALTPPPTVRLLPLPLAMPLPKTPPKNTTSANGGDVSVSPGSNQRSRAPPQIPKQFIHTLVLNQAKSNSNLTGTFTNIELKPESTTMATTSATSTSVDSTTSGSSSGSKEELGSSSSGTPAHSPCGGDGENGEIAAPRLGRRRRRNRHFNRKKHLRKLGLSQEMPIEGSVQKEVEA